MIARARVVGLTFLLALCLGPAARAADATNNWCAPEIERVGAANCYFLAPRAPGQSEPGGGTLVIFLHGLTGDGSTWQWDQQRTFVRLAQTHHFSALIPRGRKGIGPGRDPKVWAWPNSKRAQAEVEREVLSELAAARQSLEQRAGKFARVFVFGFSNGAYYATSLMLREKLDVDGFAAFAGGSGNEHERLQAKSVKRRIPMFVGWGTKDPDRKRQQELIRMLQELAWPHHAVGANVGHTVTPKQIEEALEFLGRAGKGQP